MNTTLQEISDAVKEVEIISNDVAFIKTDLAEVKSTILKINEDLMILTERVDNIEDQIKPISPPIIIIPETVDLRDPPAGLTACKGDGVTDDTQAIIDCFAYAQQEGLSVTQPEGRYLIQPGKVTPFDKMKWYGTGDNRLITKSQSLYNTMLASWNNVHDILIEGVGFDQTGDAALMPDSGNLKGMHMLHIGNCNDIEILGCKFWGNGVTELLFQPFDGFGYGIKVHDNTAYWERKVNTYYDVSVFNIDGMDAEIYNNAIYINQKSGIEKWKAETAYEIHVPDLDCYNNTAHNAINGILLVGAPMLYKNYMPDPTKYINVNNNNIYGALRGVPVWGNQPNVPAFVTQNINITDNYINLHLSKGYVPVNGVALQDGFKDANFFRNVEISRNNIDFTYDPSLNPKIAMDYVVPMNQYNSVGSVSLYTNNSCEDVLIAANKSNFPYTAFNIRAMQLRGKNQHKRIKIQNNQLTNCAIYHCYLSDGYDVIYAMENVDDVTIMGNTIIGKPLAVSKAAATATNIKYL